jgi:titin
MRRRPRSPESTVRAESTTRPGSAAPADTVARPIRATRRGKLLLATAAIVSLLTGIGAQASFGHAMACSATMTTTPQECGGGGGGSVAVTPTNSASSTPAKVGVPFSFQYQSDPAAGSWTATDGLPPGLTLSASGLLSGTPTTAGSYTWYVTADPAVAQDGGTYYYAGSEYESLTVAASAPSAPTNVTGSVLSTTSVHLTWGVPTTSGGFPITSYAISWNGGSTTSTGTSVDVTGLTTGTAYTFSVQAISDGGTGPAASSNTVTPAGVPGAVPVTSATPGDGRVTVAWDSTTPTNGAPISGYRVEASSDGFATATGVTVPGSATAGTLTGLTNGTSYSVRVSASNAIGSGPASATAAVTPRGAPGAPSVTATPGDHRVSATWAAPSANGDPISGYVVTLRSGGVVVESQPTTGPGTTTFTDLTNGTTYTVDVAATNGAGTTTGSAAAATPRGLPGATGVLQTSEGDRQVTLSWTASDPNGQTPQYRVEQSTDGGSSYTVLGTTAASTWTATGLTNGTTYGFRVTPVNDAGDGASRSVTAVPYGVPSEPTSLQVTPGDRTATATWSAPASDGGRAVTSYAVQTSTNGTDWATAGTTSSSTYDVTGLTNGQVTSIRVLATNLRGNSAPSAVQTTSTSGVPGATTITSATPSSGLVTLAWSAPDANGSPVTGYRVEQSTDGASWSTSSTADPMGTATTARVTSLTNGVAYEFRVRAINTNGPGAPGAAQSATPFTIPDAPAAPTVTPGDGTVTVTWTAPFDGGRPITEYRLSRRSGTGEWVQFASVGPDARAVVDAGLTNGSAYSYRLVAVNTGVSGASDVSTTTPRTVPGAPTAVAATPGDGSVTITWAAPTDDGGNAVSGYRVEELDGTTWTTVDTVAGRTATIDHRTNGTAYQYRVRALNDAGAGAPATSGAVTPRTVPDAPTSLRAVAGDTTVALTWAAPTDDGGDAVSGYVLEQLDTDGDWVAIQTPTARRATVDGLRNGVLQTFRVRATNAAGDGEGSTWAVAVPRTVPDAPTGLVATPGDRIATLSWTAPAWNGGAAIGGYTVEQAVGGGAWTTVGTVTGTTTVVTGLTNGTATRFRVTATNEAGSGAASGVATTTPRTVAGAPTGLLATPGDRQAALAWVPPTVEGGSAITGYVVQTSSDRGTTWTDVGPATDRTLSVDGLTNGTAVSFRVLAVNAAGRGTPSAPVTVTPRRAPGEPTSLGAVPGDGTVALSWTAPTTDGGSTVAGYAVQVARADGSWGDAQAVSGTSTTIDGLVNGTAYGFRVAAVNSAGTGAWSAVTTSTPFVFAPRFTDTTGASVVGTTLTVGDTVVFVADHLPVGAFVSLELHSTVRVLASGTVGEDGTIRLVATIPTDIETGSHHLVAAIDGVGTTIAPVEVAIQLAPAPAQTIVTADRARTQGALAFTGSEGLVPAVAGGIVVLLAGLVLALRGTVRRRRG